MSPFALSARLAAPLVACLLLAPTLTVLHVDATTQRPASPQVAMPAAVASASPDSALSPFGLSLTEVNARAQVPSTAPSAAMNLERVRIIGKPGLPSIMSAGQLPPGSKTVGTVQRVSLDQAEHLVDFPVLLPSWLPGPSYQLEWVQTLGDGLVLAYRDTSVQTLREVTIQEQPAASLDGQLFVPAIPQEGNIAEQPAAVWTQGEGTPAGLMRHVAWEHGSQFILLTATGGITADATNHIAAALREQP